MSGSGTDIIKMKVGPGRTGRRIHPGKGEVETEFQLHKTQNDIQTKRRQKIEEAYKEEEQRKRNAEIKKNKKGKSNSILKLLKTKMKSLHETMYKLGFFSTAASLFFFRNSLILLSITCVLSIMESHEDAQLNLRVFGGEGLLMLSPRLNVAQTFLGIIALIFGAIILCKEKSCLIYFYSFILGLNILAVIGNMVIMSYLTRQDVIESYLNSQIIEYRSNKPRKLSKVMISVHKEFNCCGSYGATDFNFKRGTDQVDLPLSCCFFKFANAPEKYKSQCYYNDDILNRKKPRDPRDLVLMQAVNFRGCSKEVVRFLNNRKTFELVYSSFLLTVLIPLFLYSIYFYTKLKIEEQECGLRRLMHEHKNAKKRWSELRFRLFHNADDPDGYEARTVEILKEGVRKCNNAEEILEFIMNCKDAEELIQARIPMDLAEDIVGDASIIALRSSRPNFLVTSSEEIQEKMTKCTSLTALHVNEKREKVVEKTKAHVKPFMHGEQCTARRKSTIKLNLKSAMTIKPSASTSILPMQKALPVHSRKSLIQGQLKMHGLKYQKLRLAKIIGACKRHGMAIENQKIKYAMEHTEISPKEIFNHNFELPTEYKPTMDSFAALYVNRKITQTVLKSNAQTDLPVIDQVDKSTSTNFPKVTKLFINDEKYLKKVLPLKTKSLVTTILPVTLKNETGTKILKPRKSNVVPVQAKTENVGTQVHTTDLTSAIATSTQTEKSK